MPTALSSTKMVGWKREGMVLKDVGWWRVKGGPTGPTTLDLGPPQTHPQILMTEIPYHGIPDWHKERNNASWMRVREYHEYQWTSVPVEQCGGSAQCHGEALER